MYQKFCLKHCLLFTWHLGPVNVFGFITVGLNTPGRMTVESSIFLRSWNLIGLSAISGVLDVRWQYFFKCHTLIG